MRTLVVLSAVIAAGLSQGSAIADEVAVADADLTFERDVRPILKTHCFHCHGEESKLEGDLDLRLRRLVVAGGESGPAIVPGKPGESLLIERLRAEEMPPEEIKTRPLPGQIAMIERWIAGGAKTARPESEVPAPGAITEEERSYWAFQPIRRPPVPIVKADSGARTAIDRFLLRKLNENGLGFAPQADPRTLLRRAYFDLVGLPPPPDVAEEFLGNDSPDAFERLIDHLLESPHYGERWGRHWLDVAGYADSEGYTDEDVVRPDAYKYRDYVIRSFNADKPLDQFIREQLAGDEMVSVPYKNLAPQDVDKLTATGFLRMAADGTATGDVDQAVARNQVVADTIQIVSTSLLGLTVACAQCHNHRYDPIPQADYYGMRAIFEPALDWKNWKTPAARRVSLYSDADREKANEIESQAKAIDEQRLEKERQYIEQTFESELAKLPEEIRQPIRDARLADEKKRTAEQKQLLKDHPSVNVTAKSLYLHDKKAADDLKAIAAKAAKLRATKPAEEFVRALTEPAEKQPPATFLFYRGDHDQPKQEVAPSELSVIAYTEPVEIPDNDPELPTTGRRLAYAKWLTSGRHPLLARVLVNRIWMHHFGRGLVATPGDFGKLGQRPSRPELLDWLACELMDSGWSAKHMHRLIMNSAAYQQSSRRTAELDAVDPDNRLLARMPVRRLEAETIRDAILTVSGKLNPKQFGPPVPVMADRVGQWVIGIENLNAGRPGDVIPMKGEEFRRSIYVQVRRSRPLGVLETFDSPRMAPNCVARNSSTVATQSLMLMNSDFQNTHATHFAERVVRAAGADPEAQIRLAWQIAYSAPPDDVQLADAVAFLTEQTQHFANRPRTDSKQQKEDAISPELEALTSLCHALLSSNEFLYVD